MVGIQSNPKIVRTVIETEAEALRWAMLIMRNFGYKKVIFESDSKELITVINEDDVWLIIYPTLDDMKLLRMQFEEVSVRFQPRGRNCVADG